MDNLEKTDGTIKNGQFRDTCNFGHTNRTIGNTDPTQKTWSEPRCSRRISSPCFFQDIRLVTVNQFVMTSVECLDDFNLETT